MANKLVEMIDNQAAHYGDREVFRYKDESGKWVVTPWKKFRNQVNVLSRALLLAGVKENENVAIFSQNRPEMFIADYALFNNRAVPVPVYATSSADQLEYIVKDANISMIFTGDENQYRIARQVCRSTGILKQIIILDNQTVKDADDTTTISFGSLMSKGKKANAETLAEVEQRRSHGIPEDLACLIYTSGTTGEPKGVMLTHSNFDAVLEAHLRRLDTVSDEDLSMNFLPLSHIFERAWCYFCLLKGIRIAINTNPKEILESIKEVRPTAMCSVPRFWEKVYTGVQEKVGQMPATKQAIVKYAIKIGRKRNLEYARVGKKAPWLVEMQYKYFNKKVFGLLRHVIGMDNGRFFPTAGAPLSDKITEFLHSVGINIVIGYGLTETTATVSCFPDVNYRIGTIGTVLDMVDVKISPENEIMVKGPTVMKGYYNKPEATAAAFTPDGYFHTGDAGHFDEYGNLVITERIKDLFKTSNGKYIAPQVLESILGEDKYFEQVAIIGDQRKYVTALVVPNYNELKAYADAEGITYNSIEDLVENPEIYRMLEERIKEMQKSLASYEKIKRFTILSTPFSMETGELTNTLKVKRRVVNEKYAPVIEKMYE